MSSFILQELPENGKWFAEVSEVQLSKCGARFCHDADVQGNSNLDRPDAMKVKTQCSIENNTAMRSKISEPNQCLSVELCPREPISNST